jgi:hypothetical protein
MPIDLPTHGAIYGRALGRGIALPRRGTSFDPTLYGTVTGWWDASDLATLWADTAGTSPATDTGLVARVDDKSGNGHNLTQATSGNRPTAQFGNQNGNAILRFDGSNDQLKSGFSPVSQPLTFAWVLKQVSWISADRIHDGTTTDRCVLAQFNFGSPNLCLYAGTGFVCDNASASLGSWFVVTAIFNGSSSKLAVNDGTPGTGNPGANGLTDGVSLGSKYDGSGAAQFDIGEEVIWNSALSAGNITSVVANLRAKWGF